MQGNSAEALLRQTGSTVRLKACTGKLRKGPVLMAPRESTGMKIPLQQYQKADQGLPKHSDTDSNKAGISRQDVSPPEVRFCLEVYLSRSA